MIDILVVVNYLLILVGFGFLFNLKTPDDYTMGTRTAPWWAIGLSVMATYVSALSFLGGPAWAYGDGMAALAIHIQYPLVLFLCVGFFIPFFYNAKLKSIYDYFEKRFGKTTKLIMSIQFLVGTVLLVGTIVAATSLAVSYATGLDAVSAIAIIVAVTTIYTLVGGMNAVIWADVFQSIIFLCVAAIVFVSLYTNIDGSVFTVLDEAGKLKQNWVADPTIASTIWAGVFAMTVYHVTVYGAGQLMVQRTLAAKSIGDAKKSYLLMGYSAFLIYLVFFMIGAMLYVYYDGAEFDNVNTIMLEYVDDLAMPGLLGLVVVAVLSASMSSVSSALNSLTTVSMNDFFLDKGLAFARGLTIAFGILCCFTAIRFLESEGSILEVLSAVGSYFVGTKFAAFYLGFFSKDVEEKEFLLGTVVGIIVLAIFIITTNVAWPWYGVISGMITITVAEIIAAPNRKQKWHEYSVKGQQQRLGREKENGWYLAPGYFEKPTQGLVAVFVAILFWVNII